MKQTSQRISAETYCFGVVYVKQVIERQQVLSAYVETHMIYLPLGQERFRQRISQCDRLQAQISGILEITGLRFAVTWSRCRRIDGGSKHCGYLRSMSRVHV